MSSSLCTYIAQKWTASLYPLLVQCGWGFNRKDGKVPTESAQFDPLKMLTTGCGWQREHRRFDALPSTRVETRSPLWKPHKSSVSPSFCPILTAIYPGDSPNGLTETVFELVRDKDERREPLGEEEGGGRDSRRSCPALTSLTGERRGTARHPLFARKQGWRARCSLVASN